MAKLTLVIGALLAVLGVVFFVMTGSVHRTALIPTWFGLALIVAGVLAMTEDARRRMLWMHIAVTIGLVGFIFPAIRATLAVVHAHSSGIELPPATAIAVREEFTMAGICLVFTLACVNSFIAARRARTL